MVCLQPSNSNRLLLTGNFSWLACALFAVAASGQQPQMPRVQFDAPYTVVVREALTFQPVTQPGEKLVEATFDVSSIVTAGNERDVTQFIFQVQSLQRTMLVHDYQPRSARDSAVVGKVTVNEGREDSKSAGLDLTGKYQDWTTATLHLGESTKENGNRKFDRLPALDTVVASGTIFRGTGVYFKLHTTDRQLLEGATTICVQWKVPSGWRADYVHLRCAAEGRTRGQAAQRVGQRDFLIPVAMAGDAEAQQMASRFARSEANLRMVARQSVAEMISKPQTPWSRVGIFASDNEPAVPHDWLERVLYVPTNPQVPARLPAIVRDAAAEFLSTREALVALNGWRPAGNAHASTVPQ
jgi:hypothetical protein